MFVEGTTPEDWPGQTLTLFLRAPYLALCSDLVQITARSLRTYADPYSTQRDKS